MRDFAGMLQSALKKGYKVPLQVSASSRFVRARPVWDVNPATGETIRIPAKRRIRLTPSKSLKEMVLK